MAEVDQADYAAGDRHYAQLPDRLPAPYAWLPRMPPPQLALPFALVVGAVAALGGGASACPPLVVAQGGHLGGPSWKAKSHPGIRRVTLTVNFYHGRGLVYK
jgi:hypothetical protein